MFNSELRDKPKSFFFTIFDKFHENLDTKTFHNIFRRTQEKEETHRVTEPRIAEDLPQDDAL